ncbi:MAG: hypothetical protein AUH15_10790 [Acidobacteriales bacterium 13_2_20CM_55_8]|nr:MAG: hypothetical protein AUH15_10790 [Acidobacteriales bacterium 13_2_20CM_55_8]
MFFEAAFLTAVQETVPLPLASYFDLIARTSTGGIIALGLGLGSTALELLDFYRLYGPQIFQRSGTTLSRCGYWLRDKLKHKYPSDFLRASLQQEFGDKKIGDSANRLLIPAFNLSASEIHVYNGGIIQDFRSTTKYALWMLLWLPARHRLIFPRTARSSRCFLSMEEYGQIIRRVWLLLKH